ncbi:hypothetical protein GTG28_12445 [Vibrio sp. OCN044]|uniref:Uncharacterized protein n=1 Tax=Vibrio tetraodonis subsp. pristinus TaxID=2695891 RepID=A0A6L8LVB8_9VIBR|nr:hypothetical protein [Vibrio tetraodonis]MYM60034.1 hypothetical protein [Vibrio tetraodonis subsp. pristinus]
MALPKSKSRKISLENIYYRYSVSVSSKDNGEFDLNITVQNEAANGSKLTLKGLVTRNFWLDFSELVCDVVDWDYYPKITPKHIEYFINLAISKGWEHNKKGSNFILQFNNEKLDTRS